MVFVLLANFDANGQPETNIDVLASASRSGITITPFRQVVQQYFKQWDRDGNGVLSEDEINGAVLNSEFKEEPAAAIAAVKLIVRGGKYELPPLTEDFLLKCPLNNTNKVDQQSEMENTAGQGAEIKSPPAIAAQYRLGLAQLHRTSRVLFQQNMPAVRYCQQGRLGDCYLISVVGGMVYRNPESVKSMFVQNNDGSTTVAFADGQRVNVPPLTDAELCLSSSAGTNGIWLSVLENAYGKMHAELLPMEGDENPDTDTIAHGGKPGFAINALDGYRAIFFNLKEAQRRGPRFLVNIRQHLHTALHEKRLIEAVTPVKGQLPPHIFLKHAWAVIGYDDATDMLTIWNPHGKDFTPKGPDSPENGYTTKAGRFDIPFQDVVRFYSRIIFETATPIRKRN